MTTIEADSDDRTTRRVLLTGATGFVGRYVLRELVLRGDTAVCLARSPSKLESAAEGLDPSRVVCVSGSLFDRGAVRDAAQQSDSVIHLVGIILESRLRRQTFDRVHRLGTAAVADAAEEHGIARFVHMSALGARPDAPAEYHRSKYAAEEYVRASGLDWTIFQPSVICGYDGEFMQLMKTFACAFVPPVVPYFGTGEHRIQPVSVKDVAFCFVDALSRDETVGQTYPVGGPRAYSWKELYSACRRIIPGARKWKPRVSLPVPIAQWVAATVMKTPLVPHHLKFNRDQVRMSQEDSVCPTEPIESAFGIKLRDFEGELSRYADLIG